jgi:hypothetical protein
MSFLNAAQRARAKDLIRFIKEREAIYQKRLDGRPKPWTKDPILQRYRFCNIYRENDAVTKWIYENWQVPYRGEAHMWFWMVVARLLNNPESLGDDRMDKLRHRGVWFQDAFVSILTKRKQEKKRNFNGAYIVSTNGHAMDKAVYLANRVLDPLWANRKEIMPVVGDTLASFHERLTEYDGLGSFMAAQVVADMKAIQPLLSAPDWYVWAASGPGSRRGMNRILGYHHDSPIKEGPWYMALQELRHIVNDALDSGAVELCAQNLQNCLCEFDKYERARHDQGRPKQLFDGV